MHGNSGKIRECKKCYHKISYESLSSKVYDSFIYTQKILVLALYCYRGDNVTYGLLQNACFKESVNTSVEKISK